MHSEKQIQPNCAQGCPHDDCSGAAQPSLRVYVVSAEGIDLSGAATVTYRLNGSEGECSGPSEGVFQCGLEDEGVFVITTLVADYEDGDMAATIASDGCHVRTESLTIVMEPLTDG